MNKILVLVVIAVFVCLARGEDAFGVEALGKKQKACYQANLKSWQSMWMTKWAKYTWNMPLYHLYYDRAAKDYSTALKTCGIITDHDSQKDIEKMLTASNPMNLWQSYVQINPWMANLPAGKLPTTNSETTKPVQPGGGAAF